MLFCERQWALIHMEGEWEENYLTATATVSRSGVGAGRRSQWNTNGDAVPAAWQTKCSFAAKRSVLKKCCKFPFPSVCCFTPKRAGELK